VQSGGEQSVSGLLQSRRDVVMDGPDFVGKEVTELDKVCALHIIVNNSLSAAKQILGSSPCRLHVSDVIFK